MKSQPIGEVIDNYIKREMVWYKRLWRWLFPSKITLTDKDIRKAMKKLSKYETKP